MLGSALGALSDRMDSKFLTAYWLPAFVAVLGGLGLLTVMVAPGQVETWIYDLDSVEQALATLLVVLAITMLAFVFRALSRPLTEIFSGEVLPRPLAAWSTRGQLRLKSRLERGAGAAQVSPTSGSPMQRTSRWLNRAYPLDDADVQPTLFGNVLATAIEHPRLAYTMEGLLWWPRLSPLVPVEFQDLLGGAQAPMVALLNLSVVFTVLALSGAATLLLVGGHGVAAIMVLAGGLVLAWLCYRAAVSQAAELRSLICVAFDLYRHEILRQMDLDVPADLETERALWTQLTAVTLAIPPDRIPGGGASNNSGADSTSGEAAES